jgi:hypothetical protein
VIYLKILKKKIQEELEKGKTIHSLSIARGIKYHTLLRVLKCKRPIPRKSDGVQRYIKAFKIPGEQQEEFQLSAEISHRRIPVWVDIEKYEKEIMKEFKKWKKNKPS